MDPSDISRMLEAMGMSTSAPGRERSVVPYGGRPKFVKFAPGDQGEHLPPIFFEDPRELKPKPGPLGEIHAWGLYPYHYNEPDPKGGNWENNNTPCFDGVQAMMRQMQTQSLYFGPDKPTPENQFTDALLDRKRQQLKGVDLKGLDKQDVVIKLLLSECDDQHGEPRIWRRFRVSAGIRLSTFQDKAIAPIMGWVRNFHCYTFTDYRDGSLYGPEKSDSIDRMHIAQVGYQFLPDDSYMLAHLFGKEGDKIGYLYDFGDKWYHTIIIERILSIADSHGSIEILDGKGMCPGENMNGSLQYEIFLNEYDNGSPAVKLKKKREILACPNYKSFGKPPSLFDPSVFDINAARARLSDALSSTNSVRSGAKKFTMPMVPGLGPDAIEMNMARNLKKGQEIVKDSKSESFGYWQETVGSQKDRRREGLCAACGKPGGAALKQCSGCRQVLYCSPEHQKEHWRALHKSQCSRKYLPQKS